MKLKDDLTLPKLEAMSAPSAPDCNLKVIKNRHHPPCCYYQNLNFDNGFKVLIFKTWALPILLLRLMSGNIEGRRADPTLLGHLHGTWHHCHPCCHHHQSINHYQHGHPNNDQNNHQNHDHDVIDTNLLAAEGGRLTPPAASWAAGHVGSYLVFGM